MRTPAPTRTAPPLPTPLTGVALVLGAVLAGGVLTGCGEPDESPGTPAATTSVQADPAAAAAQDAAFATELADHHHRTLQLVGLAAANASDQRVLDLAGDVQTATDARLAGLLTLLETWGRPVPHIEGHSDLGSSIPGVLTKKQLTALQEASPADFERTFLATLLVRYAEAIPLAERQLAAGGDPQAREIAQQLIDEGARVSAAASQIVGS